jgi:hypothetical protein
MAKVIEWTERPITAAPRSSWRSIASTAKTISNSRPHECAVCGSQAVLRVQPILDHDSEPPAA